MPFVRLPCAGHLLFILSLLCLLVPQQNRGPTGTAKKMLEASHSWCAPWLAKVARAQSMSSGQEKDTAT